MNKAIGIWPGLMLATSIAMAADGVPPQQGTQGANVQVGQQVQQPAGNGAAAGQWIRVDGPNNGFPTPPGSQQPAVQPGTNTQMQSAFPASSYGPANYAVQQPAQAQNGVAQPQNGVAPLPPLEAPNSSDFADAQRVAQPFTPEQIKELRDGLEETRKAKAYKPVRAIPRVSSVSVDLSPGSSLPILRVMPGEISNLVVLDSTGAPWPLAAAPRISNKDLFTAEWLKDTSNVIVSTTSSYESGNLALYLQGTSIPVVVKLVSGEPDGDKDRARIVDARLDLRVPGRGPNAKAAVMSAGKISLYDDVLQAFLDGIPPAGAKSVNAHGDVPPKTQVWQLDSEIYVRTQQDIQTAFDQSLSAGDGTRVYKLPATPFVTLSSMGRSITLQLDIN